MTIWGTPEWANGGAKPERRAGRRRGLRELRACGRQSLPLRRALGHLERAEQAHLAEPGLARDVRPRLLNPGYRAIKSVNPAAKVAGGVTAPRGGPGGVSPVDFIRRMDRAGARLDAYAHHPYPVYPGDTPFSGGCSCKTITMATLERLLKHVGQAFPSARIWLTEYAYQSPPDPFGVSLAAQARFIGEAARRVYAAPKVDLLIHYLYRDEPDIERWQSGLETVNGKAKPAYAATMLPLAQVSRRGQRVALWGQVRPGTGPQRYVIQRLVDGTWTTIAGPHSRTRTASSRARWSRRGAPCFGSSTRGAGSRARRSWSASAVHACEKRLRDQLGGSRDVLVRHVEMRDGADHRRMDRRGQTRRRRPGDARAPPLA